MRSGGGGYVASNEGGRRGGGGGEGSSGERAGGSVREKHGAGGGRIGETRADGVERVCGGCAGETGRHPEERRGGLGKEKSKSQAEGRVVSCVSMLSPAKHTQTGGEKVRERSKHLVGEEEMGGRVR